jgi:hypothetical protein
MKTIQLSRGKKALVDDDDFAWLNQWKWTFHSQGYAYRMVARQSIFMHRMIMNAPKGAKVDHKNHDRLDNRRHNLRIANDCQSARNRSKNKNRGSLYKGVYRHQGLWVARITTNRKGQHLGRFDNEVAAAVAYDLKARELHADFACVNFSDKKLRRLVSVLEKYPPRTKSRSSKYRGVRWDKI